jgi:tRNA(Ile)-lysidine synthase
LIIRPLLEMSREEILLYCQEQGLEPRWDSSNDKTVYFRNKIRLELVPWLLKEFNPNLRHVLAANARLWREEDEYLEQLTGDCYNKISLPKEKKYEGVSLALAGLRNVSPVILRRVLRRAIYSVTGEIRNLKQVHLEDAQTLVQSGRVGARIILPGGVELAITYERLIVRKEKVKVSRLPAFSYLLPAPGEKVVPEVGISIRATVVERENLSGLCFHQERALFDYNLITKPLYIRNRRPGDRFSPLGLGATKKLKDYFIDIKVPQIQRDSIPLITTSEGEILWVVGWRQDARFQVRDTTQMVLVIDVIRQKKGE